MNHRLNMGQTDLAGCAQPISRVPTLNCFSANTSSENGVGFEMNGAGLAVSPWRRQIMAFICAGSNYIASELFKPLVAGEYLPATPRRSTAANTPRLDFKELCFCIAFVIGLQFVRTRLGRLWTNSEQLTKSWSSHVMSSENARCVLAAAEANELQCANWSLHPHVIRLENQNPCGPTTTVAERLACSPPTVAIRVRSPAVSLRIFACGDRAERCCWSRVFLGDLPFPPPFHSGAAPYSSKLPLIGSEDVNVKSRPNLFIPLPVLLKMKAFFFCIRAVMWSWRLRPGSVHYNKIVERYNDTRVSRIEKRYKSTFDTTLLKPNFVSQRYRCAFDSVRPFGIHEGKGSDFFSKVDFKSAHFIKQHNVDFEKKKKIARGAIMPTLHRSSSESSPLRARLPTGVQCCRTSCLSLGLSAATLVPGSGTGGYKRPAGELVPAVQQHYAAPITSPTRRRRRIKPTANVTTGERLARSPPTKANRVQYPAGSPDLHQVEIVPDDSVGRRGFLGHLPFPSAPSFRRRSMFTSITLVGSQDLAVKSPPNLFTHINRLATECSIGTLTEIRILGSFQVP
ncbi:hypothetical protein PR048_033571 [Dryococelus australis]|uniref:Uncharacterized protein n=1 Tax=Dryococelus australis TaxID=614101 RepID=A0ABQ9G0P2_9NEOP|nr:hypothetical protein PR048_033571 [Dryococelus australis]